MKASRKDYEAIAELIRKTPFARLNARFVFIREMAAILKRSNPAFDTTKFINACEPE